MIDLSGTVPSATTPVTLHLSNEAAQALKCIAIERGLAIDEVIEKWILKWVVTREQLIKQEEKMRENSD